MQEEPILTSKEFAFDSQNVATSAAGSVRCEVQDPAGVPLPGYSLDDAEELIGDEIEREVSWRGVTDVRSLSGKALRLRFVMKDAELFSIRLR